MALQLAAHLRPLTEADLRAERDVFAWWREQSTVSVAFEGADGVSRTMRLPHGTPPAQAAAVGQLITTLSRRVVAVARRVDHPGSALAAVADDLALELHDGLAGLVANGLCGAAVPPETTQCSRHVPAGDVPTRAPCLKEVEIASRLFHDTYRRFFAVPQTTIALLRTGRSIVVRSTGTCPFPDRGTMAAVADEYHPAWLPEAVSLESARPDVSGHPRPLGAVG